ncbi:MAG: helix-turn-helix transcriptional regulator [Clostridium sp.]
MHNNTDILSSALKAARQKADITMEALADKIGITERYLYRIENENKKPSFDVLQKLIRELAISADSIFYPDKPCKDTEVEDLIRMLYNCDERSMEIIRATVKAALESQSKE